MSSFVALCPAIRSGLTSLKEFLKATEISQKFTKSDQIASIDWCIYVYNIYILIYIYIYIYLT